MPSPPLTTSFPGPAQIRSPRSPPRMVSDPPRPTMTSLRSVPTRTSALSVPTIVARSPEQRGAAADAGWRRTPPMRITTGTSVRTREVRDMCLSLPGDDAARTVWGWPPHRKSTKAQARPARDQPSLRRAARLRSTWPSPMGSDDTARSRRTEVGRDRTDLVGTDEGRGLRGVPRVPRGERGRGAAGDGREPRRDGATAARGRRGRVRRGLVLGLARGREGLRRRGRRRGAVLPGRRAVPARVHPEAEALRGGPGAVRSSAYLADGSSSLSAIAKASP